MQLRFIQPALVACFSLLLVYSPIAYASDPMPDNTPEVSPMPTAPPTPSIPPTPEIRDDLIPPPPATPPPQETPSPSPPVTTPTIPPALPTPPGGITIDPQLGVDPGEVIPVVVTYDAGQEARARIFREVMDPVGLLQNQVVTVTLQLPPTKAGELVHFGLYDGGLIGAAALPGSETIALDNLVVPDSGTVRFNFKAGKILGLYRLQVTIGPSQYLLQFYAVQRATGGPLPALTPTPSPEG